jgi:hypothetical protein
MRPPDSIGCAVVTRGARRNDVTLQYLTTCGPLGERVGF